MSNTIPDIDFINNSNQRTPCVLILDGSGSMEGEKIAALNQGLVSLQNSLMKDSVARSRVRLLVLQIGGNNEVEVLNEWTDAINFTAPTVSANGTTPLGGALNMALDKIEEEKNRMKASGVVHTRPLVWIITDGVPTDEDDWTSATSRAVTQMKDKKVQLYTIGVEVLDTTALEQTRPGGHILQMGSTNFAELFAFLSASVATVSKAAPGEEVQVPLPQGIISVPA